jgi:hypothetical protein
MNIFRVSEWLLVKAKWAIFSYSMARASCIRWDDGDVNFVLDQHDSLDFDSTN